MFEMAAAFPLPPPFSDEGRQNMMKFGLLTAILANMSFKQVVDFAAENNLECLEVACWPSSGGEKRRYAGVCHIDAESLTEARSSEIREYCEGKGVKIASLGYYPNTLDPDPVKRKSYVDHIYALIDASHMLGVDMVTTFLGRVSNKTVTENLEIAREVWRPILDYAQSKGVRIGIENCPMWFTDDEWPGGQNIMTSPENWKKVFEVLPYDNLGINYDPSHFVWQQMDYIRPIYEFRDKIFQVHFKDIKLRRDRLAEVGVMANPLEYMVPKLCGLGDVNWSKFISALTDIHFQGCAVIEIEDKAFEGTDEDTVRAIKHSAKYLRNFI
jgi:sugar phosphate isomerase/epimerase